MLSLSIADTKDFMTLLLKSDCFDDFDFHNIIIHSFACFEIGKMPQHDAFLWKKMKPYVFEIIKGNTLPKYTKIVLCKNGNFLGLSESTFFLNITYENGEVSISTGVSQKSFSLDRSAQICWNEWVLSFFDEKNILYTDRLAI